MNIAQNILIVIAAIMAGIITGSGSVYAFNHMPDKWLKVNEEDRQYQRVKSVPWKYVLSGTFSVIGIHLGFSAPEKAIGIYIACIIVVEILMGTLIYGVIPSYLTKMLALTAVGILPFGGELELYILGMVAGTLTGLGFIMVKGLASKKQFFWDIVELSCIIGLLTGWKKAIIIIITGFVLWALVTGYRNIRMKKNRVICEGFFVSLAFMMWLILDNGILGKKIDLFLW